MDRINKKIEDFIEKYFSDVDFEFQNTNKRKPDSENFSDEEILEQDKLINSIYSNIFWVINDKEIFQKSVNYIIDVLNNDYPILTANLTKDKEKILYKTVDSIQQGEKVFGNFDEKFQKTIKEIIQS